jgi:hypothetical protein
VEYVDKSACYSWICFWVFAVVALKSEIIGAKATGFLEETRFLVFTGRVYIGYLFDAKIVCKIRPYTNENITYSKFPSITPFIAHPEGWGVTNFDRQRGL